jgi:crossover junction endodeoxyribonuclease RusA
MVTTIVLPWPPSVNACWRTVQGRTMVSKKGRIYKQAAARAVLAAGANKHLPGRLRVKLTAYPPDRRRRDIDNLTKLALDSMQVAGVYLDDSQIDELTIIRAEVEKGGVIVAEIETIGPAAKREPTTTKRRSK